ncbi:MAG: BamA/TamA family outer membrane protein [Holophagaceae bacterium]|nr:BamA/TamA family outer membrane protein [Holophagaceae bacterium]
MGADLAYKQFTRSLGISTGTRLSTFLANRSAWAFFTTVGVGYNFSIVKIEGGRNFAFRDTNSQLTSTFNTSMVYSTVNHPFKPTAGTKLGAALEYGGWQFGTDKPFMRATFDFSKFGNIADRHIFAFNASYGYLRNLSSEELPAASSTSVPAGRTPSAATATGRWARSSTTTSTGRSSWAATSAHPERGIPVQDRRPVPDGALLPTQATPGAPGRGSSPATGCPTSRTGRPSTTRTGTCSAPAWNSASSSPSARRRSG